MSVGEGNIFYAIMIGVTSFLYMNSYLLQFLQGENYLIQIQFGKVNS